MNISVAMAVYNGGRYLREQLDSILKQLDDRDEIVISYNSSEDDTLEIIEEYAKQYEIIHVLPWEEQGVISNFENAIIHCTKNYIFLSDQDDVWTDDKVQKVMAAFESDPTILTVMHNCEYVDEELNPLGKDLFKDRHVKTGFLKNLVVNCYQGSCMAFRKDLVPFITPMPRSVAMHDQWIGIMAERAGHIKFLTECLMKYRKHDSSNSTDHVPLGKKIKWMIKMTYHVADVLNEKKMLKWYLQSIYAPEKKADFDLDEYGYSEQEANERRDSVDFSQARHDMTRMYMVDVYKEKRKEEDSDQ